MLKTPINQTHLWTKTTLTSILLVANAFVWYYSILIFFQNAVTTSSSLDSTSTLLIWGTHFSGLIFSAIAGASLAKKIDRSILIIFWIALSIAASFSLLLLNISNPLIIVMIGLFLGVALGLGMPACMSLYSDSIPIEKRGRIGGITMLITGIGIFVFSIAQIDEIIFLVVALVAWRIASLIILLLAKSLPRAKDENNSISFKRVVSQKSFLLYFIPWFMFSLVNYLTSPLSTTGPNVYIYSQLLQIIFMGVFAVLGGFFIDYFGRKRVAITGFATLGIGTAVLALDPGNVVISYFNAAIDGVAWGFLLVLFILTVWGDLSNNSRSDKYYAIGVLPFFISKLLETTVGEYLEPFISSNGNNAYAFFSFTAFFLFLAVLPLVYAPETLPEKTMKDRDLSSYVEKAKKIVEKEDAKKKKADKKDKHSSKGIQESSEDEKARKLAEKYY